MLQVFGCFFRRVLRVKMYSNIPDSTKKRSQWTLNLLRSFVLTFPLNENNSLVICVDMQIASLHLDSRTEAHWTAAPREGSWNCYTCCMLITNKRTTNVGTHFIVPRTHGARPRILSPFPGWIAKISFKQCKQNQLPISLPNDSIPLIDRKTREGKEARR